MKLTAKEQAYLAELAAQIVTTLGADGVGAFQADPIGVLKAAHDKRQEFAQEILQGRSDRSKMFRIALTAEVYIEAVTVNARRTALEHCEHIAEHTFRRTIGLA